MVTTKEQSEAGLTYDPTRKGGSAPVVALPAPGSPNSVRPSRFLSLRSVKAAKGIELGLKEKEVDEVVAADRDRPRVGYIVSVNPKQKQQVIYDPFTHASSLGGMGVSASPKALRCASRPPALGMYTLS